MAQLYGRLASAIFFLFCLLSQHAVVGTTIYDVFDVDHVSCTGVDLAAWFTDCQILIQHALVASGQGGNSRAGNRELLKIFFDYKKTGSPKGCELVYDFLVNGVFPDNIENGYKPQLYCTDQWQQEKSWDDKYIDIDGSEPGTTLAEAFEDQFRESHRYNTVPYFWPQFYEYEFEPPGGYCGQPRALAGTSEFRTESADNPNEFVEVAPRVVTLCVDKILSLNPYQPTLDTIVDLVTEDVSLAHLTTQSMNLYHEVFHLVLTKLATPDIDPYSLSNILSTRNEGLKRKNPESYVFFSLAQYLAATTDYVFDKTKAERAKRET